MTKQIGKSWIGRKIDVLDHGYVLVVDSMGTDADICAAARVSYAEGCRQVKDDAALIDHMMRHGHTSPFEQAILKLEVKLPIVVEREMARHRTASWNEMSGRFGVLPEEYYVPAPEQVQAQSRTNKQGRAGALPEESVEAFREGLAAQSRAAFALYHEQLEKGVARELARLCLPLNAYTKKVWTIDLHNLLHFLKLRTAPAAMWEIRRYAETIEGIVAELWPLTHASWRNHVKGATSFAADELAELRGGPPELKGSRLREFEEKKARLAPEGRKR